MNIEGYAMPDGYVLCADCATTEDKIKGHPVFDNVDSWDARPCCDVCFEVLDVPLTIEAWDVENKVLSIL